MCSIWLRHGIRDGDGKQLLECSILHGDRPAELKAMPFVITSRAMTSIRVGAKERVLLGDRPLRGGRTSELVAWHVPGRRFYRFVEGGPDSGSMLPALNPKKLTQENTLISCN